MSVRVVVDAMGGDHAPEAVVEGCARAARETDITVILTGDQDRLGPLVAAHKGSGLQVAHAPEVIGMAEAPAAAAKGKPGSSIHLGLGLQKAGKADAFVSAGNTGAAMAVSLFTLGRLQGVARPAVIGYFPTVKGFSVLVDVGTNVDCKPEHLLQFAFMGSIYARRVLGRTDPVVALMNVGEEPGKGNEQAKAAFELLEGAENLNFRGNIEGRDVMMHAADVIVMDGFVGNIMLKLGESVASVLPKLIGQEMESQQMSPEHRKVVGGALKGVLSRFDYEEYGGVPLLGVNGNVILGHGGSSDRAFANMVKVAARVASEDVTGRIASALATSASAD